MRIGSILENQKFEKRIAITPEVAKKYIANGFEIFLVDNYGSHLGINNKDYLDLGVKFFKIPNLFDFIVLVFPCINFFACIILELNT